jgi:hypothetical protein
LSSYARFHWRLFNVLARLFGIMALLVGAGFCAWGVYFAIDPGAAQGVETAGIPAGVLYVIVGAFSAAIGTPVLRIRPYRPALGDAAWTFTKSHDKSATQELVDRRR